MRPLTLLLCVLPFAAAAQGPLDRLRALTPSPDPGEVYAGEMAADRALIAAEAAHLFGPGHPAIGPAGAPVAIAIFIGPGCPDCGTALADLADLGQRLAIRANVIDTAIPENAALMSRLTLDLLPSYVLPGALIRGWMPAAVLERDLAR